MRTFPNLRERVNGGPVHFDPASASLSQPLPAAKPAQKNVVSGFFSKIAAGLLGPSATPQNQLSSQVPAPGPRSLYHFHEGDLFTPGAQNFAFDAFQELPMNTIWGHGFLRTPNTFQPIPESPVSFVPPGTAYVKLNGVGGLVAGQMAFQPLENTGD